MKVLIEHAQPITSIDVSNNKNLVVTGSKDKLALIWNFRDGSVLHKLNSHQDEIVKVFITLNGSNAITGFIFISNVMSR